MLGDLRETRTNGIGPPKDVTVVLNEDEAGDLTKNEIWTLVTREARAVSVWALLAPIIRIVLSLLVSQTCVAEETCTADSFSVPGFVFASAWYVLLMACCRDDSGVFFPSIGHLDNHSFTHTHLRVCYKVAFHSSR